MISNIYHNNQTCKKMFVFFLSGLWRYPGYPVGGIPGAWEPG